MSMIKPLRPEEDAFGQKLLNAYRGNQVFEIVERDDGYVDALDLKTYFSDFEEWDPIERKAMKFVKGRVLDIGCGAGRHSLYLQKKGLDVLGIDISPLAIQVCKERGLKKAKVIPIEEIKFPSDSFDTIIMMGNNFGLFGSFKTAKKLLRKFYKITSDNAMIIAETRDPYKTDNPTHLEYHKLNRKKGRMGGQVRIRSRYQRYVGRWFDYLMVSKDEMKDILKETGWEVEQFIDSEESQYITIITKTPERST